MTAVSLVLLEHNPAGNPSIVEHKIEGFSYSPFGVIDGIPANEEVKQGPLGSVADVAAVSALCNDAYIVGNDSKLQAFGEDVVDESGKTVRHSKIDKNKKSKADIQVDAVEKAFERVGEPTEAALCVLAEKLGGMAHYMDGGGHLDRQGLHFAVPPSVLASANVKPWRSIHPRRATLEFNRDRKSMSVLCDFPYAEYPAKNDYRTVGSRKAGNRLLVKGAPNLLIDRCTHVKFRDGTVSKLTGDLRREIQEKTTELAVRPLRCLALAVKESDFLESSLRNYNPETDGEMNKHPLLSDPTTYADIESGLTLVGIVGIKDPARPEVADSINQCTDAGIRVMMITGDAKDTAVSIARDVNIFPEEREGEHIKVSRIVTSHCFDDGVMVL